MLFLWKALSNTVLEFCKPDCLPLFSLNQQGFDQKPFGVTRASSAEIIFSVTLTHKRSFPSLGTMLPWMGVFLLTWSFVSVQVGAW